MQKALFFSTAAMLAVVTVDGAINGFTLITAVGSIATAIGLTYIAIRAA